MPRSQYEPRDFYISLILTPIIFSFSLPFILEIIGDILNLSIQGGGKRALVYMIISYLCFGFPLLFQLIKFHKLQYGWFLLCGVAQGILSHYILALLLNIDGFIKIDGKNSLISNVLAFAILSTIFFTLTNICVHFIKRS
jgi:hypothetical protein